MTLIKPAIHSYLLATNEEREPDGLWHPSSLFQCDRQALYQVRGTPESDPKTGEDMIPLALGKALHEIMQAAVTHAQGTSIVKSWHEVKVHDPDLGITGSADSLVLLDDGTYEVEEFKSTKSAGIKWAKGDFQPKPNHVSQGLTYVYAMRHHPYRAKSDDDDAYMCPNCQTPWKCNGPHEPSDGYVEMPPLGDKLTKLRVTYFGKDAGEILEFTYEITPEWEDGLREYIAGLERYRASGELPPRLARDDKGRKNWLCAGYCNFRSRCWNQDGEGVEL